MLELLGDADQLRYSAQMTDAGLRAALSEYSRYLPRLLTLELEITQPGREQALGAVAGLLCVSEVCGPCSDTAEAPTLHGVSAYLDQGRWMLHFGGAVLPVPGQRWRVRCGAAHTLSGLDGALTTTLPEADLPIFLAGAVSYALTLRIAVLSEVSGLRPGILRDLRELAAVHRSHFQFGLGGRAPGVFAASMLPSPDWRMDAWTV
jgi:hypothetical protein